MSKTFIFIFLILFIISSQLVSQNSDALTYQMPPKAIADLIDAPPTPGVNLDPTRQWMLIMEMPNLPTIDEVAQPELRLAGMRINPKTFGPSRSRYSIGLSLMNIKNQKETKIKGIPEGSKIRTVRWAPNGKKIAFLITKENGNDLWVVDVDKKEAQLLVANKVSSVYGSAYSWLPDNKTIICKLIREDIGKTPEEPSVSSGPIVQEATGKKAPARTYQDLLKNSYDEALFDYYFNVQVYKISLNGKMEKIGSQGIIRRSSPSPNGKYILVETVHRPFSYLVPAYRFPYSVEVWDLNGKLVKQIADLPLAEEIPIGFGAVPTGPRSFGWRADESATLYWAEAQDGGDPKAKADIRDKVFTLPEPFSSDPKEMIALGLRYSDIVWSDKNLALVSEWWWATRRVRTWKINPTSAKLDTSLIFDYSWQDRYNDPGNPLTKITETGYSVLLTGKNKSTMFLTGAGASEEGDRPFIDEFDLKTKKSKRLWRSTAPYYERTIDLLNVKDLKLMTRRESTSEPPNFFIRDIKNNKLTQLTKFQHPTPQLKNIKKVLIRYDREDGVKLTATLYLPPDYKVEDGPLPMIMWAYPTEYKSADAAGQVTDSPYRFVRVGWWTPLLWLVNGYAVLDDPSMPVVGEGDEEPNDTFVNQLVSSAKAAIDEVVRRGVADRDKIAIGGHSYGAFMTANLLAHSDLYATGIARSGAYNRTLTPFGFQAEERTFWQAPEIYFAMSPFMHADKVNEPILLIHGEADNNSGTFPMQSERFYNALKGHGAIARLVMLPHESHGYRGRESVMHMLWEMDAWLDKYVKNAAPPSE